MDRVADLPLTEEQIDRAVRKAAELAAPIFKEHGWTWFDSPKPPNAKRIRTSLRELVAHAAESPVQWSLCGRFMVQRFVDEMGIEEVFINLNLSEAWGKIDG